VFRTSAKGLNLAASDVGYLSQAMIEHYRQPTWALLNAYSARPWRASGKVERMSWRMTQSRPTPARSIAN
jgi:p-hydroxybenzoate 3-monooxygenase